MAGRFRLTMAQLDPTVGDIAGNKAKALAAHRAGGRRAPTSWRCPSSS